MRRLIPSRYVLSRKEQRAFFSPSFRRNLLITLRGKVALSENGTEIEPHETEISKTKEVAKKNKENHNTE